MARGFVYLAAVVDWFSRKVLAWKLSITLDTTFCIEAVEEALAGQPGDSEHQRIEQLSRRLRDGLLALPAVSLNGCATQRIAHTLNLCIDTQGFNSAALASELALSTTSACNSASNAASHVLLALGLDESRARNSVRLSLGRFSTEGEVDKAIEVFTRVVAAASASLW